MFAIQILMKMSAMTIMNVVNGNRLQLRNFLVKEKMWIAITLQNKKIVLPAAAVGSLEGMQELQHKEILDL